MLKFAPLTVITIFLQNLTGIIEKKSIPDILDLMVTNKLNIILLSLLFGYLLLIYNTNKQLKILEDTLFYLKEYSYKNKKTKNKKVFYE